ncbi:hypothetical protein TNCV_170711 [Trichonephila clavipes]|nr:hypothetical protein TNCV_170711 [Trichonephila clavipes]
MINLEKLTLDNCLHNDIAVDILRMKLTWRDVLRHRPTRPRAFDSVGASSRSRLSLKVSDYVRNRDFKKRING